MLTCSLQYLERTAQMRIEEEVGAIAPLYNKLVSYREDAKRITRHGGDMDALGEVATMVAGPQNHVY